MIQCFTNYDEAVLVNLNITNQNIICFRCRLEHAHYRNEPKMLKPYITQPDLTDIFALTFGLIEIQHLVLRLSSSANVTLNL